MRRQAGWECPHPGRDNTRAALIALTATKAIKAVSAKVRPWFSAYLDRPAVLTKVRNEALTLLPPSPWGDGRSNML
jgi:hypothetical protein